MDWLSKLVGEDEATELRNLHISEVSLVDRAANKRRFLLWKAEDGPPADDEKAQRIIDGAIEAADRLTKTGGDEVTAETIRKAFAAPAPEAAAAVEAILLKAADRGELEVGDCAGLVSQAMELAPDKAAFVENLSPDVMKAVRADSLRGRNSYIEAKVAQEQDTIRKARQPRGGSADEEIMAKARSLVEKADSGLDLADAILRVRAQDPELTARSRAESLGYSR